MGKSLSKSRFIELFGDIKEKNKWPREKWSDVCEIINGKDFKSVEDPNGQYAVYGTGGFMAKANQYTCPENSIIIGRKGTINKPLLVKEKFWNIDTAFGVVPNITKVHYQYFYWFCKQFNFMSINKGTTLPSTTKTDLQKIEINVPPLELQLHFSHLVDQIDKSKFILQKMIEKLELLKKSRFVEMFGDPVLNPYKLKKDSFRHICEELFAGGDKPSDIVLTKDETHPYPVYANGYENLGFMGFSSQCRVNKPAITISARGTIGFSCIRQAGFTPIVRLLTLIPKTGIDLDYLKFAIDFYSFTSSGTSQKQLTVPDIAKYEVLVPDYSSQQCFATFIHQLDKLKLILQKQLEDLVGETK